MNALHLSENKCTLTWEEIGITLLDTDLGNGQKRFVRVGDFVDYKMERDKKTYYSTYGDGPYQITRLGKWRCGAVDVEVHTKRSKRHPIRSKKVYHVSEMSRPLTHAEMVLYFEHRPEFSEFRNNRNAMFEVINEFDALLQEGVSTYSAQMNSLRTFLIRYLGLPQEQPTTNMQH